MRVVDDPVEDGDELPLPLAGPVDLPSFPLEVLPEWLRAFAYDVAQMTQTPTDLAGVLLLAALAAAAGGHVVAVPRSGWEEPTNLFVAVALVPGNRKSAVFTLVTEPIRSAERTLSEATAERIASRDGHA